MKTIRENIQLMVDSYKIISERNRSMEYNIVNVNQEGLSYEQCKKMGDLFYKQDMEITNLRYLISQLVETFVGENNYKDFMGINQ